ncbi:hypothetical protein ARMGADRAFT_1120633 [Armillaria gallica]|uniref:Uncharacterized protein n=1 Tax=Armillaria gallica TaxID=47427 RepID=A0A2H3D9W9_ARMGA|nr:hypothetical protein ARMGADRAFT_1120633 [Armillaria gallica]
MKLKEIHRTSTFTVSVSFSSSHSDRAVADAFEESFSNESQLKMWAPNYLDKNEFSLRVEAWSGSKGAVK